jgi:preprotein translocase subunit YajC
MMSRLTGFVFTTVLFGMTGVSHAMGTPPGGASAGGAQSALMNLVPLVLMFGIFYFLLIRPQQKKAKDHRMLLDNLKKGDQVITAGGMHGKVTAMDDTVVTLEIATGVNVKYNKGHISSVVKKD